jgi:hypothetical protein
MSKFLVDYNSNNYNDNNNITTYYNDLSKSIPNIYLSRFRSDYLENILKSTNMLSENDYCFEPFIFVNMDVCDTVWWKINIEIRLQLSPIKTDFKLKCWPKQPKLLRN